MSRRSRRKKEKIFDNPSSLDTSQSIENTNDSESKPVSSHHHYEKKKEEEHIYHENKYGKAIKFYDRHYKHLLILPILLLVLAFAQIGWQTYTTGDFIQKGITLKGGLTVMIPTTQLLDQDAISKALITEFPKIDLGIRTLESTGTIAGYVIEMDLTEKQDTEKALLIIEKTTGIKESTYGIETIEPSLGASFFEEVALAMVVAFIFMAIVVFLAFRTFIPSLAAVFSVFADMVMTLAAVNLLEIKISSAGIAAFLMLIGYSVDTDILLSTRVLKRDDGTVLERIIGSIKTGMTMTICTIAAATIAIIFTQSETLKQIMIIILIGMFMDIFNTWITNVALLRWYIDHKAKKKAKDVTNG